MCHEFNTQAFLTNQTFVLNNTQAQEKFPQRRIIEINDNLQSSTVFILSRLQIIKTARAKNIAKKKLKPKNLKYLFLLERISHFFSPATNSLEKLQIHLFIKGRKRSKICERNKTKLPPRHLTMLPT